MIRYTIMVAIALSLFFVGCSQNVLKWHKYEDGAALAKSTDKHMLVYFTADSCFTCDTLENEVFNEKDIAKLLKQDFIPIKINLNETDSVFYDSSKIDMISFRRICKVPLAPTWAIFKSDEEWLESFHGLNNAEETKVVLDFYRFEVYEDTKLADYLYFRYFNSLLEKDKTNPELQYLCGYFYYHAVEKLDIAEKYFLKVVELDPTFSEAYALIYKIKIKNGNVDQKKIQKWIEKAKENGFEEYDSIISKTYELAQKYGPPVW